MGALDGTKFGYGIHDTLVLLQHIIMIIYWLRAAFKDGAYYCYCAYVQRISRYSDFLSVMLTNSESRS